MSRHHLIKVIVNDKIIIHKIFEVPSKIKVREFSEIVNNELTSRYLNKNVNDNWDTNLMNFSFAVDKEFSFPNSFAEDHQTIDQFCPSDLPLKYCRRCRILDKTKVKNDMKSRKKLLKYINSKNIVKIKSLLEKGLDPNFIDQDSGETPLSLVVSLFFDTSQSKQTRTHSQKFKSNASSINNDGTNKYSTLKSIKSAKSFDEEPYNVLSLNKNTINKKITILSEIFSVIVQNGAYISYKISDGLTVVHRMAILNNYHLLNNIIDSNYFPYVLDSKGLTPFYVSITSGCSIEVVRIFFNYGGYKLDEKDEETGNTIFHHLSRRGFVHLMDFILTHCIYLCKQGVITHSWLYNLIEQINNNGNTALKLAVANGNIQCATLLEKFNTSLNSLNDFNYSTHDISKLDLTSSTSTRFMMDTASTNERINDSGYIANNCSYVGALNIVHVIKPHLGANSAELTLCVGDQVQLLNQFNSGCSYGVLCHMDHIFNEHSKEGWFPTSCVSKKPRKNIKNQKNNDDFCIPRDIRREFIVGPPYRISILIGKSELGFEIKTLPFVNKSKKDNGVIKKTVQSLHEVGNVISDSQAYKAGLVSGTLIMGVDEFDVSLLEHSEIINLIKKIFNSNKKTINFTCCTSTANYSKSVLLSASTSISPPIISTTIQNDRHTLDRIMNSNMKYNGDTTNDQDHNDNIDNLPNNIDKYKDVSIINLQDAYYGNKNNNINTIGSRKNIVRNESIFSNLDSSKFKLVSKTDSLKLNIGSNNIVHSIQNTNLNKIIPAQPVNNTNIVNDNDNLDNIKNNQLSSFEFPPPPPNFFQF